MHSQICKYRYICKCIYENFMAIWLPMLYANIQTCFLYRNSCGVRSGTRRDIHDQGGAQAIQVPNCTTGNCSSHKIKALLNGNAISVKLLANLQDIPRRESRVNLGEGHVESRIQVGLNSDLYMSTVHSWMLSMGISVCKITENTDVPQKVQAAGADPEGSFNQVHRFFEPVTL